MKQIAVTRKQISQTVHFFSSPYGRLVHHRMQPNQIQNRYALPIRKRPQKTVPPNLIAAIHVTKYQIDMR